MDEKIRGTLELADRVAAQGMVAVEMHALELGLHLGFTEILRRLVGTPLEDEGWTAGFWPR